MANATGVMLYLKLSLFVIDNHFNAKVAKIGLSIYLFKNKTRVVGALNIILTVCDAMIICFEFKTWHLVLLANVRLGWK
jgi:hypothetical protein